MGLGSHMGRTWKEVDKGFVFSYTVVTQPVGQELQVSEAKEHHQLETSALELSPYTQQDIIAMGTCGLPVLKLILDNVGEL